MRVVSYGGSYLGRRPNNEDSIGRTVPRDPNVLDDKGRLYLVCDGMGGTRGGEVASHLAVETIMDRYYAAEDGGPASLRSAIMAASSAIADRASADSHLADMGSTVIALVMLRDRFIYAHVGDSRAYLLRENRLIRLTRDHLHILDDLGVSEEEAETHPHKNILSRALGYLDACSPDCGLAYWRPDDRLLLCSDGLSDSVPRDFIQAALQKSSPQEAVDFLLQCAEDNDAHDNSTALVVYVVPDESVEQPTQRIPIAMLNVLDSPTLETANRIPTQGSDAAVAARPAERTERN